jgi:hypothetical protein
MKHKAPGAIVLMAWPFIHAGAAFSAWIFAVLYSYLFLCRTMKCLQSPRHFAIMVDAVGEMTGRQARGRSIVRHLTPSAIVLV